MLVLAWAGRLNCQLEWYDDGSISSCFPESATRLLAHLRTLVIVWRLLPLGVSFRRDFRRWIVAGAPLDRDENFHGRRAAALIHALVSLGPTFVKLAQVFASRPDVVPEPYLSALGTLVALLLPPPKERLLESIESAT